MAFANMLGGRDPMDMTDDEIRASLNEYYTRYVPAYCPGRRTKSKNLEGFLSGRLFLCLDGTCPQRIQDEFIHWEFQMRFWLEVYIPFISELIFIILTTVS